MWALKRPSKRAGSEEVKTRELTQSGFLVASNGSHPIPIQQTRVWGIHKLKWLRAVENQTWDTGEHQAAPEGPEQRLKSVLGRPG